MNTSNTLLESYQQWVYKHTLARVKCQIQQAENPMPAVVISMVAAGVASAILLDNLTSEVALEQHNIGSTDRNIPIGNNCMNAALHVRLPRGSGDDQDESDETNKHDANLTPSWWRRAATELESFDLGANAVERYSGDDGDNAHLDEKEEASQADDGSTQNLEDSRHCTREYEDWTAYFRPEIYDNDKATATGCNVSESKTVL